MVAALDSKGRWRPGRATMGVERSWGNARLGQSLPLRRFRHDPRAPHRTLSL